MASVNLIPPPGFIPPNIVLLTAPQLLGMMFNWALWGILTVQVYIYHLYFKDSQRIRALVWTLYVLECIQSILSSADIFHWFAWGYGRLDILSEPFANPVDLPIMAGIIAMIVQLYFTWRIRILSGSIPLAIIIGAVSVAQGIAGVVAGIMAYQVGNLTKLSSLLAPKLWLAGAALSDTIIAITMIYFLYRAKQRSLVPKTNYILKRIISLTIETNSLSAGVAILALILFIKFPDDTLFICPPYALGKLYSNTLLVIFNNRIIFPNDKAGNHPSIGLKGMSSPNQGHTDHFTPSRDQDDGIKITVLTQTDGGRDLEFGAGTHSEMTKRMSLDVER